MEAEVLKRWLAQAGRVEKKLQGYRTDTASIFSLLEETVGGRITEDARKGLELKAGSEAESLGYMK